MTSCSSSQEQADDPDEGQIRAQHFGGEGEDGEGNGRVRAAFEGERRDDEENSRIPG